MSLSPTKAMLEDASTRARALWEEFRNFAFKGNVVDLAVGVVIGAAFGKIIDSLVKNLIMPLISLLPAFGKGYEQWALTVGSGENAKTVPFGLFLADVVNFLIVALALYLFIVKFLGWALKLRKEQNAAAKFTKDQQLLIEIRDLLKSRA